MTRVAINLPRRPVELDATALAAERPEDSPSQFGPSTNGNGSATNQSSHQADFQAIAENLPALLLTFDCFGDCDYVNRRFTEITGLSPAVASKSGWRTALHPDDAPALDQAWSAAGDLGEPFEIRCRIGSEGGVRRWHMIRFVPLFTDPADNSTESNACQPRGRTARWLAKAADIHDLVKTQEALAESETRYRDVVNTQTEMICRYLPDSTLTFVNDAYCRFFGKTREQLIGTKFIDLIPEADRHLALQTIQHVIDGGLPLAFEHEVLTADGGIGWQRWIDHVISDDHGQIRELQGIGQDITERRLAESARQASESRFKALYEGNLMPICIWSDDSRVIDANDAYLELTGFTRAELEAGLLRWDKMTRPEHMARAAHAMEQMQQRGVYEPFEKDYILRDGRVVTVLCGGARLVDQPDRGISYAIDVSERVRAREALQRSQERYRLATAAGNVSAWELDLATGQIVADPVFHKLFGDDANGVNTSAECIARIHPNDQARVLAKQDATLAHDAPRDDAGHTPIPEIEYRVVEPDGQVRWLLKRGTLLRGPDGTPQRMVGTIMDVTQRRLAEESVKERLRFEVLLSELSAALQHALPEDFKLSLAGWLERLAGFLATDKILLGECDLQTNGHNHQPYGHACGADSRQHIDRLPYLCERMRAGQFVAISSLDELPARAAVDRQTLTNRGIGSLVAVPLMASDPSIGGLLCIRTRPGHWSSDSLARMKLAAEIIEAAMIRSRMRQETQRKREELARAWRIAAIGELTTTIAHELNQPLAAVLANAQAAVRLAKKGGSTSGELHEALGDIVTSVRRANELIQRLRKLLRGGSVGKRELDLNGVVRDIEPLLQVEALHHRVTLVCELHNDLPLVEGDHVQLQQVFLNLVRNACEATSGVPGGVVRLITACGPDGGALASVVDQGPALEPEIVEHLFEPFYTTKPDGLGIGLAISRSLIEDHGGQLSVSQNSVRGLTITFALPHLLPQGQQP